MAPAALDTRFKLPLHIVQLALVLAVVIMAAVRMLLPGAPRGRNNTMALGMGAKSIIIILYQIGSGHWGPMKRWASLKANAILNSLEVVFWAAVVFLTIQGNIQVCVGVGCTLGWAIMGIGIVLVLLSVYGSAICILEYRHFSHKKQGLRRELSSDNEHPLNEHYFRRV